ncbi:uncharacterized protein LOC144045040 [Vanacampus margaritifer]
MGSGTSRGTKVAPAGLGDSKPAKKASSSVPSSKRDAFDALRVHARRRAPVDCHSAGHDSELSGDDDDADAEADGYDEAGAGARRRGKKEQTASKKAFTRSRTYGLCHFSSGEEDEQQQQQQGVSSTSSSSGPCGAQGPHGSREADNNKRSHHAFAPPPKCSPQAFLTTGPIEDVALSQTQTAFGQSTPPLTTPVILYDGSEEELMDTIEREFS